MIILPFNPYIKACKSRRNIHDWSPTAATNGAVWLKSTKPFRSPCPTQVIHLLLFVVSPMDAIHEKNLTSDRLPRTSAYAYCRLLHCSCCVHGEGFSEPLRSWQRQRAVRGKAHRHTGILATNPCTYMITVRPVTAILNKHQKALCIFPLQIVLHFLDC